MSENTFYCSFVSIHYIICECGVTFPSEEALKEHLEKDKPHKVEKEVLEEYKCGTCGQIYVTEAECLSHIDQDHVEVDVSQVEVKQEIREEIKEEVDTTSLIPIPEAVKNTPITVTVSSRPYKLQNVKKTVVEVPSREKKSQLPEVKVERRQPSKAKSRSPRNIICEVCGKSYASNAALRYHQRVHTGVRPYQCKFCPKNFTMPLFLQIHTRIHTGEKPYACALCPKAFTNKAALLRHDRVHTGARPYTCPKCGKSFTQSNSMKLHVLTVHLKMPAPYKSKKRRAREQQMQAVKTEQQDYNTEEDEEPYNSETQDEESQEMKTEKCDEYNNGDEVYYVDQLQDIKARMQGEEVVYYDSNNKEDVTYEVVYQ